MVVYLMSGHAEMIDEGICVNKVWCANIVSGRDRFDIEAKFSVFLFQRFPKSIYEAHKIVFIREVTKEELTQLTLDS